MISEIIKNSLLSLTPLWTNGIVRGYSLSGEYAMAINPILSELIRFISFFLNDFTSMFIISLIILYFTLDKLNIVNFSIIKNSNIIRKFFTKQNSIEVVATEVYVLNQFSIISSISFRAVNQMLINKYDLKDLTFLKDSNSNIYIGHVNNFKLEDDLYLDVKTIISSEKTSLRVIKLTSRNKDLKEIVTRAIDFYNDDSFKYKITLNGIEENNFTYKYPQAMEYLTYILINVYKMNKLKVLFKNLENKKIIEPNKNKDETNNNTYSKIETNEENNIDTSNNKNIFILENYKNYKLEDDIYITIERNENIVSYTLFSNTVDLKEFLISCINKYKVNISKKDYKYNLKLTGNIYINLGCLNDYGDNFSKYIKSLNHCLIEEDKVTNYIFINKKTKIIDDIEDLYFNEILLSVKSKSLNKGVVEKSFILSSNTVNLNNFIDECVVKYDEYLKKINNKNIYHFKYLGRIDDPYPKYKFSTRLLSNNENKLYENFDNIFNEHKEYLKNDLQNLKDLEYYKRTGMRRKKSYLFYGEPGCGKNSSIVAMALHDKRHIIEIPLTNVQYNTEFDYLMNLNKIDEIDFNKDNIIYIFDEIDVGLERICEGELRLQNEIKDKNDNMLDFLSNIKEKNEYIKKESMAFNTLDLGFLLSQFDGIGNYGGVIYVGLTNHIEKIPESLKRSLRLTPIYFTLLRKCDVISIIEKIFDITLSESLKEKIPDRKINPANLRMLCENKKIEEIIEIISC